MLCDLLIPAYNHPNLLRDLLLSLEKNTDPAHLGRILIGDDGSDSFSKREMARLVENSALPITLISRPHTLGFGANCNDLFAKATAPYCIVLNTDVLLPPGWLERMLAPFGRDPTVALATPLSTNAANHTIALFPGETWLDADRSLAAGSPAYPDDCTAIGFCMAVDRAKLLQNNLPLFDPLFTDGYGEDSDLHYRMLATGFRSVVVDNLLVHHIGGASFETVATVDDIRQNAQKLFRKRWGTTHDALVQQFELHTSPTLRNRQPAPSQDLDVLLILPTTDLRYGGIWMGATLVSSLMAAGKKVAVLAVTNPVPGSLRTFGLEAWADDTLMGQTVSSIGCVLASDESSLDLARRVAQNYSCPEAILLQGMEVAFRSGRTIQTFRHYQSLPHFLCVSEALEEYAALINPHAEITPLRAGPDPLVFYPRDASRMPKSIAIGLNGIPEKGASQALEFALLLKERGFTLFFFGWDTLAFDIPDNLGTVVGPSDRRGLAHLFSSTEFLVDYSFAEGLGLLPLEAAFCGCIPVLHPHGGPEYIFTDSENSIILGGYKTLKHDLDRITGLAETDKARMRENMTALRSAYGLRAAMKKAEEALDGIINH